MKGEGSSTSRPFNEELHGEIPCTHDRLDVIGEDGLVEFVGAKRPSEEEGSTTTKERAHSFHVHEICTNK